LPPNYTFTLSDNGTHNFGTVLFTAGAQTLTALDTANSSIIGSATIAVTPAPANHLLMVAPATTVAGMSFDVTITALDPYGNVDTNYTGTATFSSSDSDPGRVLPADYTFVPSDQGVHTFASGFILVTAGPQTLTATDTANAAITGSATVTVQMGGGASSPGGPISSPVIEPIAPVAAPGNRQPIQPVAAVDRLFASLFGQEPAFPPAWHAKHGPLPELFGTTLAPVA